jgi:hypothetical protein
MRRAIGVLLVALATGCQTDPQPVAGSARETREVRALATATPTTGDRAAIERAGDARSTRAANRNACTR